MELIYGDALEIELPNFDVVVSNLPYSISTPITFRLLEKDFDRGILTYQLEFARRLVARVGTKDYGRLSVAIQHYCDVRLIRKIPRGAFYPRPSVDSGVVELKRKQCEKVN